MPYCKICNSWDCDKHVFNIGKTKSIKQVSGSSPPEIFVGKYGYPNIYAGILTPEEYGDTSELSMPESWHSKKFSILEILEKRNKLIYGRQKTTIKNVSKFTELMQEVAMTSKSIATELSFKNPIQANKEHDPKVPLIANTGEITSARLQENTKIEKKIDYIVNDSEVKSSIAILELEKAGIQTSTLSKILSAGLLGLKKNRKLVPTRWSITAVDDTLSKAKLEKIRSFKELSEIQLFHASYLGNHYEFLLLPEHWSFEVLEISEKGGFWHDYELFFPRKSYANDVTGAYYVNRLAVTEYLERIKKQASCIVFRSISNDYNAPLGVGILRQTSREAFSKDPEKPNTLKEALNTIQERIKKSINQFATRSILIKEYGKQTKLNKFF